MSLGNVLSASAPSEKITFLSAEDEEIFRSWRGRSFEVQVAKFRTFFCRKIGHWIHFCFNHKYPMGIVDAAALLHAFEKRSSPFQVALHELLGHGSGKLLREDENGVLNYDKAQVATEFLSIRAVGILNSSP